MNLLYDILFEEYNVFAPPYFCLVETKHGVLTLIHVPTFLKEITRNPKTKSFDYIAGFINLKPPESDSCLQVYQVGIVVGNPSFRGAGYAMYGLASDYYNIPITSDRGNSTSRAAKDVWNKITNSSEWKEVAKLDNYGITKNFLGQQKKMYVKFDGNNGKYKLSSTPNTPQPNDDCILPSFDGKTADVNKMIGALGTPNVYKYSGQLKAKPLVAYTSEVFGSVNKLFDETDLKRKINIAVSKLWDQRYKRPETTR